MGLLAQNYSPDRTDQRVSQALIDVIKTLVDKKIPCSADDLKKVLERQFPNLPFYLKQIPDRYGHELNQTKPSGKKQQPRAMTIDVNAITAHLVSKPLEPLETVMHIDHEHENTLSVNGQRFKLDFSFKETDKGISFDKENFLVFVKILHTIMECTDAIHYRKRLQQALDFLHTYASQNAQESGFAKYVFKAYQVHQKKYVETMNTPNNDSNWLNRFSTLSAALFGKHSKLTDSGRV